MTDVTAKVVVDETFLEPLPKGTCFHLFMLRESGERIRRCR